MSGSGVKNPASLDSVRLLGVRIHTLSVTALVQLIERTVLRGRKAAVVYVNVHALNLACELPRFKDALNGADVTFCDGHGVRLGAKLAGLGIPHRYTPPDWIDLLATMSLEHGFSMYFLGAERGVAEQAAAKLLDRFPTLQIGQVPSCV